ncbi:MAG: DUF1289 domain-containing protein [Rickettsiales bacterium]|nr:DUF1289 domain-containing protein [Rickettsiales bacterium]
MLVKSPCIGICKIDQKKKICVGCLRTLEQIENWSQYCDKKKLEIINCLKYE